MKSIIVAGFVFGIFLLAISGHWFNEPETSTNSMALIGSLIGLAGWFLSVSASAIWWSY